MTNRKISEFTALTAPASTDTLPIIDQSGTGADKNKKITYANLLSKAPDGSASAPAFSFSSDTNSGISGGSDTLTLSTGGVGRLTISSAGLVTIPGDLTVAGTTTTIDSTTLTVKDKNIEIAKGNGNDAAVDGAGITIDSTDGDKTWNWVDSTDAWTSSEHIDLTSGKVLKVAGTQVLSATNFTGTSAIATNVTVADESSDTTCNVLFTTAATGNLPPKTGTNLTFNSSSGALTATSFVGDLTGDVTGDLTGNVTGNLTGNVTGNTSGSSGSCTGNAATATALETSRTIAGVSFDGTANISLNNNAITNGAGYITATLTQEQVEDYVGGMVTGNTETGITVTYQDADGTLDFVVGTLNQDTTGNAATATALETARTINGTSFDGSANITVTAAGSTLTGTSLKSTIVSSSLTSVGTLTSLVSGAITTTDNLAVDNAKEVRLYEADSNGFAYVGIKGATDKGSEASYTVSLPAAAPTANQILKANASTPTNLEWAVDSGGIPDTGGTFTGKVTHNYTSSIRVPVGTTGQRDGSPSNGDFRYNSTTGKFEGYQSGSWGEIGGGATGAADLLAIASSSGTGGGSATFNGSAYRFKLVTKGTSDAVTPANAEILRVSINGVMQQPNDGTGQGDMTDGYVVSGTDIIFDSAPPSGATYFIVNMGTQIAVGNASTSTIADESSDTTCFPLFATAATGDLALKSGSNLTFNSSSGTLAATVFSGSGASLTNLPSSALTGALPAIDGSALTGVSSQKADGCVTENALTISNNYTMTTNKSGLSAGDITIANGVTVTIPSGSRYVIV
jgi:hypothetical protein